MKTRKYRIVSFVFGSMALTLGLLMEYVPILISNGKGYTIPQGNAVCSGAMGAFLQGMAHAFGSPSQNAQLSQACTISTTAEHFIGPLIVLGAGGIVAGLAIRLLEQNGILKDGAARQVTHS